MATIERFGDLGAFKIVTPDEIARVAYYSLRFGLLTESLSEAVGARKAISAVLPILGNGQLGMLLTAPWETATSEADWLSLKHDIEAKLS